MFDTPTSLAGYQSLCDSPIDKDDLVLPEFSNILGPNSWRLARDIAGLVGAKTEADGKYGVLRIYRKSAVPKQSDSHEAAIGIGVTNHRTDFNSIGAGIKVISELPAKPKAKTDDEGKPPLAYLPWKGLREVALVQAYGHSKYKDYNNYRKGMEVGRNVGCAIRHLSDYMEGQDLDSESGRSHLAHAACRVLFVLQNLADGTAIDDRYKK